MKDFFRNFADEKYALEIRLGEAELEDGLHCIDDVSAQEYRSKIFHTLEYNLCPDGLNTYNISVHNIYIKVGSEKEYKIKTIDRSTHFTFI